MRPYRDFLAGPREAPTIVAHRGAWHAAPENSVAAIRAAADAGFEIVEIDVRLSADGTYFVMHDPTLDRTTEASGPCQALTMDELSVLHLRFGNGGCDRPATGETVPTLDEALEAARGRVYLDLDVKEARNLAGVARAVADRDMAGQCDFKMPVRSRSDADTLLDIERQYGLMAMPIIEFDAATCQDGVDLLAHMRAPVVETAFDTLETVGRFARAVREIGTATWVNTLTPNAFDGLTDRRAVSEPDDVWGALVAAGVDVVQTDEPELLMSYRNARRRAAE